MHKLSPPRVAKKRCFVYFCENYSAWQPACDIEEMRYLHTQERTIKNQLMKPKKLYI